jgi:hypothetical protein
MRLSRGKANTQAANAAFANGNASIEPAEGTPRLGFAAAVALDAATLRNDRRTQWTQRPPRLAGKLPNALDEAPPPAVRSRSVGGRTRQ